MITSQEYKKSIGRMWMMIMEGERDGRTDEVIKELATLQETFGLPVNEMLEDVFELNRKLKNTIK